MKIIETTAFSESQKEQLKDLWNKEYPVQLQYQGVSGLDDYLAALERPYHAVAVDDNDLAVAWVFSFDRDGERWFAIIIDDRLQRQGLGTAFLGLLKQREQELCGWVVDDDRYLKADGTPYPSPLLFYLKQGFALLPDTRLETDRMSAVKIRWSR